ncbi:MAG: hypothetical protein OXI02_05880, partial [Candidatus Dadabacteria bacterium]|nr:hypothetical protein [Candidatus Dadabacteria bacterium]
EGEKIKALNLEIYGQRSLQADHFYTTVLEICLSSDYNVIIQRGKHMKINLISIGNSKGIRIPSSVIKQCGLGDELEMRVENGVIVLAPVRSVREGWSVAFEKMVAVGDDVSLVPDALENDFDAEDWTW